MILAEAIKVNTKNRGKTRTNQENLVSNVPNKQSKPDDELKIYVNRNPRYSFPGQCGQGKSSGVYGIKR